MLHDMFWYTDWMDPETKKNALDKAEAIDEFIAYPSELIDNRLVDKYYAPLELEDNFFGSVLRIAKFGWDKKFEKVHMAVNKSDWVTHGRATVVNAFYNLVENSIQFPAGKSVSNCLFNGRTRGRDANSFSSFSHVLMLDVDLWG